MCGTHIRAMLHKGKVRVTRLLFLAVLLMLVLPAAAFPPYRSTDADTGDPYTLELRLGLVKADRQQQKEFQMGGMFTWKGRFGPMNLDLSEHTFSPSTVSVLMAEALEVEAGDTVIDAGCGSGILSIIAAKLGASRVVGIDIARDTVAVASSNAAKHGVGDVTEFYQGDLFEPLPEDLEADVVIGDVSGIPDDLAAESGWFPGRSGGGPRGSELPIRMLEGVRRILRPGGRVFLPTGTLQDENAILSNARELLDRVTKLVERRIPIPNALAESQAAMDLVKRRVIELTPHGSRFTWTARVWVGARP